VNQEQFKADLERYSGFALQLRNAVLGNPRPSSSIASARRIQMLGSLFDAPTRYLEIGVWKGHTFSAVQFDHKDGVDPLPKCFARRRRGEFIHRMTSDVFFAQHANLPPYDVVFLDGLHTFEQTARDLWNSMSTASPQTVWLIDDVVPANEAQAAESIASAFAMSAAAGSPSYAWTGDVYRLAFALDRMGELLDYRTIVGSGREQLLVWLKSDDPAQLAALGQEICAAIPKMSYGQAFPDGSDHLPPAFRPASELDSLLALRQSRSA